MSLFATIPLSTPPTPAYVFSDKDKLGEGSGGIVYKGKRIYDPAASFSLAPKRLKKNALAESSIAIKVFKDCRTGMHEVQVTKVFTELRIPHTIRYIAHQFCGNPQRMELILDLVPGQTLNKIFYSLKWKDIRTISEQAFEMLLKFHEIGFIHGDLKLDNMLYEPNARYLTVIDYGLAGRTSRNTVLNSDFPYERIQCTQYRAPEIYLGMGHTTRADLWSLGIVIYALVTKSFFAKLTVSDDQLKGRMIPVHKLFSLIELPSIHAVEKIKDLPTCPWTVENGVAIWKEPFEPIAYTPWKELFRSEAVNMKAPGQDIELFTSILSKIFRFEDRASIEEISQEYKDSKLRDINLEVTQLASNQKLIILSDQISVVFDNSKNIYRSCLHIPQNSSGKYSITLIENEKTLIDEWPFRLNEYLDFEINIPDLIALNELKQLNNRQNLIPGAPTLE